MSRPISETVLHAAYIPGPEDSHGNATDTWGPVTERGVYAFDPGSTSEPREPGHDRVIVEPTLYAPADVLFGAYDLVTARGKTYQVDGETREWRHTDGTLKGNVITLRRVEG